MTRTAAVVSMLGSLAVLRAFTWHTEPPSADPRLRIRTYLEPRPDTLALHEYLAFPYFRANG
ncbi:MAG: hypothetical protein JO181_07925 [Solirubrobacterales bacterium]|nr:hypothetical protein [Solirubrobacterales bacterium]